MPGIDPACYDPSESEIVETGQHAVVGMLPQGAGRYRVLPCIKTRVRTRQEDPGTPTGADDNFRTVRPDPRAPASMGHSPL